MKFRARLDSPKKTNFKRDKSPEVQILRSNFKARKSPNHDDWALYGRCGSQRRNSCPPPLQEGERLPSSLRARPQG